MGNKKMVVDAPLHNQAKGKGRVEVVSRQTANFPHEISTLLDVLSRIEARRQARLLVGERG